MKSLILVPVLLGHLTLTSYRSVPSQTKGVGHTVEECMYTSIGERVNVHGCAISQDLLASGTIKYGDLIYIEGIGFKFVNDTMNKRLVKAVDVWVQTKEEEHSIKVRQVKVWLIKRG